MKNVMIFSSLYLILACSPAGGGASSNNKNKEDNNNNLTPAITLLEINDCRSAVNFDSNVLNVETGGEVWVKYKGKTDLLQVDTCDSGQNGTFEVYHSCEWYEQGLSTINGRNSQKVKECYDGFYGDVLGIREKQVVIKITPADPIKNSYHVNFNEIGN